MAQQTDEQLKQQAGIIKNETAKKANTAERNGQMLENIIDSKAHNSETKFIEDIVVQLSGSKSFGKYTNGQTIPAAGKTVVQVLLDVASEYLLPSLSDFLMSEQDPVIEIGGSISAGSHTFTWIMVNSDNYDELIGLTIRDETADVDLATAVVNDGSHAIALSAVQLNAEGATQVYRLIGKNSNGEDFFKDFTVTADYVRRFGTSAEVPDSSSEVRALAGATFGNTFSIPIAQGQTIVSFAYEASRPDITDSSVKYVEGFNSNVGATFTKQTFNVNDAGGTPRSYKVWTAVFSPYPTAVTYNVTIP